MGGVRRGLRPVLVGAVMVAGLVVAGAPASAGIQGSGAATTGIGGSSNAPTGVGGTGYSTDSVFGGGSNSADGYTWSN